MTKEEITGLYRDQFVEFPQSDFTKASLNNEVLTRISRRVVRRSA